MVEDRRERKVELAELRGARAGKHQWRTHHNAAQRSSSQPAPQESHLQGSEQRHFADLSLLSHSHEKQEGICLTVQRKHQPSVEGLTEWLGPPPVQMVIQSILYGSCYYGR
ncbi:unnamed protein product [Pleuronectes platessa]|uniref:Uncharacterized protein n=1 Tax=Pleuronectes platessa TaxID=8262 RepID=A0A9N7ZDB6_PLEPL|nr:unnamed protein product [Pleuronectes platessa]